MTVLYQSLRAMSTSFYIRRCNAFFRSLAYFCIYALHIVPKIEHYL